MARVSDETLQRYSKERRGEHNPHWKGDKVGYTGVHDWVKSRLRKPQLCQRCFSAPPYDLANITGRYIRDLTNWKYLPQMSYVVWRSPFSQRQERQMGITQTHEFTHLYP